MATTATMATRVASARCHRAFARRVLASHVPRRVRVFRARRDDDDDDDADDASDEKTRTSVDTELSNRWIDLDPAGYFLVKVDHATRTIEAAHFENAIDDAGRACDPVTGEVIPCDGSYRKPAASATFAGRTAKQISVKILETEEGEGLCTMLVHANYLGREFQRAEACLREGTEYVQD